jgi:hypothetical protein
MSTPRIRAEEWIRHLAWIGKHDDPCAVASEAAGVIRELLDQPDLKVLADHSVALGFLREVIGLFALVRPATVGIAVSERGSTPKAGRWSTGITAGCPQ